MKSSLILSMIATILTSCGSEPPPVTQKDADVSAENELAQDAVKERQLSIEEAAEQATKLIEADAKAEADAATVDAVPTKSN